MVTDSDGSIDHRPVQGFFVRDTRPIFFYNMSVAKAAV
ncbi:glycogen debranching N-terminal domain-containing protein [Microcoleus vaginatus]